MATTLLANLINPEVIADFIDAKLVDNMVFAPLADVDTTLEGRPGSVLKFPVWRYIGDASTLSEASTLSVATLTASTASVEVHKIAQGVELSKNLVKDADVVLYLIDSVAGKNDEDEEFIKNCPVPLIEVWNKCDAASQNPVGPDALYVSAKNGIGLPALFNQLEAILKNGISTERTQAGLGSARQKAAVSEALESARHALLTSEDNYTLDAVVQDLEDALDFLGEVTGAITPDDVLGSIFANFCVGK